jgi:hypothetical protein
VASYIAYILATIILVIAVAYLASPKYGRVLCSITFVALIAPFVTAFYVDTTDGTFASFVYAMFGIYSLIVFAHIIYMKRWGIWTWKPVWFYVAVGFLLGVQYTRYMGSGVSKVFPSAIVAFLWFCSVAYMIRKKYTWELGWRYAAVGGCLALFLGPFITFVHVAFLVISAAWPYLLFGPFYIRYWKSRNIGFKQQICEFFKVEFPEPDASKLLDYSSTTKAKYQFALRQMWNNQFYRPLRPIPSTNGRDQFSDLMSCTTIFIEI